MKIPLSIRRIYDDQYSCNERLKEAVDRKMLSLKSERWHYESRIKDAKSFALKIESGRFTNLMELEDFFACTIVVSNAKELNDTEALISSEFSIIERRPKDQTITHKTPDAFPFDDLRIYAMMKPEPALPLTGLEGIKFELQIKTFLQHAWSIATHDLLYKTDDVDWNKQRIAYQIKAMLEHAELSILEADRLAASGVLGKQNTRTTEITKGISLLRSKWNPDDLPDDLRRLSENIISLINEIKIDISRLGEILDKEKAEGRGALTRNLSPFGVVIQSLLSEEKDKMISFLKLKGKSRMRVVIPAEIDFPNCLDREDCVNAIFIK